MARPKKEPKLIDRDLCVLWDRGRWRGWSVGWIEKHTPRVARIKTSHLGELIWTGSDLEKDVEDGRVFVVNPDQVVQMLSDQISNIDLEPGTPADGHRRLAQYHLNQAAVQLRALREEKESWIEIFNQVELERIEREKEPSYAKTIRQSDNNKHS